MACGVNGDGSIVSSVPDRAGLFQQPETSPSPSSWWVSEVSSHSWCEQELLSITDTTLPQPDPSPGSHLGEDLIRPRAMAPFRGPGSFPVAASRRDKDRINPAPASPKK